jgi:glycerol-3-phosphate O-acyltransferase
MLDRFGALYYLSGLAWAYRKLRLEDHSAEKIRQASSKGPVVYALHSPGLVDWLALNRVLLDRKLPLPAWTNGVSGGWLQPIRELLQQLWDRLSGKAPAPQEVGSLIKSNQPICLFVAGNDDPLKILQNTNAQILPVVVIWRRVRPVGAAAEFIAGLEELPGPFTRLWSLANATDPLVQIGDPVSMQEFSERYADEPESRRRKMLRLLLRRYLFRETQVVLGPRTRNYEETQKRVLQSPEVRALVELQVREGKAAVQAERKLERIYGHIAARFSARYLRMAAWVTRQIWKRIYSGIDIREEDLERIREAIRKGTPILVPCHKSHLDYMLLSSILYDHDLAIPHIVAGENLSFWPVGAFFRRMGAFFIKRSFTGDPLFPVIFTRYVQELVRMEVPVEFFIEGGRSRTGKLLPPKVGVLGMVVEAAAKLKSQRQVSILPIYIGYARIAEEKVFARELSGAPKEAESVQGVVKAASVLRERYGRVYVRVAEAIPLESDGLWEKRSEEERSAKLKELGYRILARIDQEILILPISLVVLAILAHGRRGIRHSDLKARTERFLSYLRAEAVKEPPGLKPSAQLVEEAVRILLKGRGIEPFDGEDGKVYSIIPARRVQLEYYKNALLPPLAYASFYAAAIRSLGQDRLDLAACDRLFLRQAGLFGREFIVAPETTPQALLEQARAQLLRWELLIAEEEGLKVVDRSHIGELANLTCNFVESYLLVLKVIERDGGKRADDKGDISKAALKLGKTLLAVDELVRPEALNLQNLQNAAKVLSGRGDLAEIKLDLSRLVEGIA